MTTALPALSSDNGLAHYLNAIKQYPLLTYDQEVTYAHRLRDENDQDAAFHLVTSHLRLVAKIAMRFRGYGLPMSDVISEGNIGLMQAVRRFDPDRGFRLATYATWWVKATIQEYILKSWSIVKIAASPVQKRLFFNLRRLKSKLGILNEGDMRPDEASRISSLLQVPENDLVVMNMRMMGDMSVNTPAHDGDDPGSEWIERLPCETDLEEQLAEESDQAWRQKLLTKALSTLTVREQRILEARWLADQPATLDELGDELGISRERVRQIEVRAMEKARKVALDAAQVA